MPQIVMGPNQTGKVDPSVKKAAYTFLEKLAENDAVPGLHIEPINGSADRRVRTGRVNDFWRAVLFKIQGQADEAHYVYVGVLPHDDAIAFAKKTRLKVNPVNGIAELVMATEPQPPAGYSPTPSAQKPAAAQTTDTNAETPGLDAPAEPPAPKAPSTDRHPAPAEPLLAQHGVTRDDLLDLGVDKELAEAAVGMTTDDELLAQVERAPEWQALALIDLAGGKPIEDVRATLGIGKVELEGEAETDDELLRALQHEASRLEFAFIESDEELRKAIEEDDFAAWRVFLHPEQRRYATASYKGPFRLSGGAGTGKTVVLLHRARHLARQNPGARILLTTFNKVLAASLQIDLRRLDPTLRIAEKLGNPGIYVAGVDSAVSSVIRRAADALSTSGAISSVLGERSAVIRDRTSEDSAWRDAISAAGSDLPPELRSVAFLQAEYTMVVLPQRVTDQAGYLKARRPGRGVALDRKKRQAVWKVVAAYRARAAVEGSVDYDELASIAAAYLEALPGGTVDHVLVDEGQDLTPSKWQFLQAVVAEGDNDLFIAEDSHQRIYGHRVVLGQYGIRIVGRSRRLTLNYRTTEQNLRYAIKVLEGADYVDMESAEENSSLYRSARRGPEPDLVAAGSLSDGLDRVATTVSGWIDEEVAPETIGILVRDRQSAQELVHGLDERGVDVRLVDGNKAVRKGNPLAMTMHRAKGMEFARLVLFDVSKDRVPAHYAVDKLSEGDRDDALLRERSLLYVAATRARDKLVVVWRGMPSELLPVPANATQLMP